MLICSSLVCKCGFHIKSLDKIFNDLCPYMRLNHTCANKVVINHHIQIHAVYHLSLWRWSSVALINFWDIYVISCNDHIFIFTFFYVNYYYFFYGHLYNRYITNNYIWTIVQTKDQDVGCQINHVNWAVFNMMMMMIITESTTVASFSGCARW